MTGERQTPDEFVEQVRYVAMTLPDRAWELIKLREEAKGPLAFEFARPRVRSVRHRRAGSRLWLVVRRSLERVPDVDTASPTALPTRR